MFGLSLFQFAGFEDKHIDFDASNIILGENGSGKTKILESLIFLMNGVPIKERSPKDYLSWDGEEELAARYGLSLHLQRPLLDEIYTIDMHKKLGYFHQQESLSRAKYLDLMPYRAILFHPAEMNIVYGPPALRRQHMDTTLQLAVREAHNTIREYEHALKSRNSLLKSIGAGVLGEIDLEVWDEIYTDRAIRLAHLRSRLVQAWMPGSEELCSLLGKDIPSLRLLCTGVSFDGIERGDFLRTLTQHRKRDIILGYTTYGPHHDDFDFVLGSLDAPISTRDFLSRGENKTLLLYLKARQMRYIEQERPDKLLVLLFDDIFAELDSAHIARVIDLHMRSTTIYTTAQSTSIPPRLLERSLCIDI